MKKLVAILLVLAILVCVAAFLFSDTLIAILPDSIASLFQKGVFDPFNAFNAEETPETIKTLVDYVFVDDDGQTQNLQGSYETVIDGEKSTMVFSYQRLATVEDMLEDGRIVTVSGTIYKDGDKVSADGDTWEDGAALPGSNFTLNLQKDYFTSYGISEDKSTLTGILAPEKIVDCLGVALKADGDVYLVVTGNGTLVTGLRVSYTSVGGASVLIRTSYTYGEVTEEPVGRTEIDKVATMYAASVPTKAVASTKQDFGEYELLGESTLLVGTYNGRNAAIFTYVYQELTNIDNYNSTAKRSVQGSKEYFAGMGVRTDAVNDPYAYFEEGDNFAPTSGSIALNLDASLLSNVSYVDHVFTATVAAKDLKAVFGEDTTITTSTQITIRDEGNLIKNVTLTYRIPSLTAAPDVNVTVSVDYSYDVQTIVPIVSVG